MKVQDVINQLERFNPNADLTLIMSELDEYGMGIVEFPVKVDRIEIDTINEINIVLKEKIQ